MHVVAMVPVDEQDEKRPHIETAPLITVVGFQDESKLFQRERRETKTADVVRTCS
jgi:hypothetical protein